MPYPVYVSCVSTALVRAGRMAAALLCSLALDSLAQTLPAPLRDPLAALRAQAQAARLSSIPVPPVGVREMAWSQLSPAGWNAQQTLDRLGVAQLQDDDPAAPAIMAEVRRAWQQAPAATNLGPMPVRLTGFPVMPDDASAPTREIILAPYYGACVHSPTPPPNQMVLVTLAQPLPRDRYQYPIWVTGSLSVKPTITRQGRVAYRMVDATWEAYPYQKYPMPPYQLPR